MWSTVVLIPLGVRSMFAGGNIPAGEAGYLQDRVNVVASSWGSLIGWDQQAFLAGEDGWHKWSDDGVATFTESAANIGTFFIPVAGVGKVVLTGTRVGSFVVKVGTHMAEFAIPGGSHLISGVVRAADVSASGVRGGWRSLIDAVRLDDVRPAVVPGVVNVAVETSRVPSSVTVSESLGLDTPAARPVAGPVAFEVSGTGARPERVEVGPASAGPRVVQDGVPVAVPESVGVSRAPEQHTPAERAEAWDNAWRNDDGVRVDPRTGAPLVEFNRAGTAGWEMRWVPEWNEWVAFNRGDGWGATPRPLPEGFDVDHSRAVEYESGDVHYPGAHPAYTPDATYVRGGEESGWAPVNRGPDRPWMGAQEQISGILRDENGHLLEWHQVDPDTGSVVKFDGHTWRQGPPPVEVFLEVKNGYGQLHFAPRSEWAVLRTQAIARQLTRQVDMLPDSAVLEWHVTDAYGAHGVRRIVDTLGFDGFVEVIYTPKVG
ncbi:hypothetical protein [Microbacterium sp. SA39]|uniref:hypothetical protein n=1 Tax=Microbacterium sp. SA39 TaxID=1263625 RepID=UPI0005FA9022|nr:hypothetical protein [Microbacterium sp. SA39]KJQ55987.1 hypothetical protein RS85_00191 [Microbacterium sp. SA39]